MPPISISGVSDKKIKKIFLLILRLNEHSKKKLLQMFFVKMALALQNKRFQNHLRIFKHDADVVNKILRRVATLG